MPIPKRIGATLASMRRRSPIKVSFVTTAAAIISLLSYCAKNASSHIIIYFKLFCNKTSFEKFIKTYKRYIEDPVGYITASGGATFKVIDASTGRELTPAEIRKSKITVNVNDASVSSSRGYDPIEKIIE